MPQIRKTDKSLFYTTILLAFFGLVMVYSASSITAKVSAQLRESVETNYALQQAVALAGSIALMMLLKRVHYKKLQSPSVAFAAVAGVLMLLVIAYVFGRHHRFVGIGSVSIQPAELAKPALVVFLAYFVTLRAPAINDRHTIRPAMIAVGAVTALVVLADLGTAVVLGITATIVFIIAGLEWKYVFRLAGIASLVIMVAIAAKPYRANRVWQWFDESYTVAKAITPGGTIENYLKQSKAQDSRYQVEQSKIAIGSGGPRGLGPMQGIQKLFYIPEAHTDFIYAVVGEEFGLAGTLGILAAFSVILWRGYSIAAASNDDFGRYMAIGITTMIVVQAFVNMSVVLGIGPTKGIPLPLISFGSNSLISTLVMMGILLNVSENQT